MKPEQIMDAIGKLSEKTVSLGQRPVKVVPTWVRFAAMAASLALVIGIASVIMLFPDSSGTDNVCLASPEYPTQLTVPVESDYAEYGEYLQAYYEWQEQAAGYGTVNLNSTYFDFSLNSTQAVLSTSEDNIVYSPLKGGLLCRGSREPPR